MLKYWSNAFMTTGSAMLATAIFAGQNWQYGVLIGSLLVVGGAILNGLSIPTKKGKQYECLYCYRNWWCNCLLYLNYPLQAWIY